MRTPVYLFHGMIGTALMAFFGEPSTTFIRVGQIDQRIALRIIETHDLQFLNTSEVRFWNTTSPRFYRFDFVR